MPATKINRGDWFTVDFNGIDLDKDTPRQALDSLYLKSDARKALRGKVLFLDDGGDLRALELNQVTPCDALEPAPEPPPTCHDAIALSDFIDSLDKVADLEGRLATYEAHRLSAKQAFDLGFVAGQDHVKATVINELSDTIDIIREIPTKETPS